MTRTSQLLANRLVTVTAIVTAMTVVRVRANTARMLSTKCQMWAVQLLFNQMFWVVYILLMKEYPAGMQAHNIMPHIRSNKVLQGEVAHL
jgi:hypothetical protein